MKEQFERYDPILEEAISIKERLVERIHDTQTTEAPTTSHWGDLVDIRISEKVPMLTPQEVVDAISLTETIGETTLDAREDITSILNGEDDRLLVIAGPCSIHSAEIALEYAEWLAVMREMYGDSLEIVMRAYMEKPRTELGWKGLMNDPLLNKSYDLNLGVVLVRLTASKIVSMGVPIAMERLGTRTPQYLNGLVAYDAIGARNTTDQNAREYASGSSSPVGFKNTPEGSIKAAVEAAKAATAPHVFPGTGADGRPMIVRTTGNPTTHIILRGDQDGSNYSDIHIAQAVELMEEKGLIPAVVVDASHGNSQKDYLKQPEVIREIGERILLGKSAIRGVMIESNLVAGSQPLDDPAELLYGQSITDGCVDLDQTEDMLSILAGSVQTRRKTETGSYRPFSIL